LFALATQLPIVWLGSTPSSQRYFHRFWGENSAVFSAGKEQRGGNEYELAVQSPAAPEMPSVRRKTRWWKRSVNPACRWILLGRASWRHQLKPKRRNFRAEAIGRENLENCGEIFDASWLANGDSTFHSFN
jgi:hypothetical protein